jgi:ethanolamine-phosphate phospho-lyase
MYDQLGNKYLDCINNVAHGRNFIIDFSMCFLFALSVGHCHPDVVTQIYKQMGACATNNRYLHDNTVILAEKLSKTLPQGLDQFFYTNSG